MPRVPKIRRVGIGLVHAVVGLKCDRPRVRVRNRVRVRGLGLGLGLGLGIGFTVVDRDR